MEGGSQNTSYKYMILFVPHCNIFTKRLKKNEYMKKQFQKGIWKNSKTKRSSEMDDVCQLSYWLFEELSFLANLEIAI